MNQSQGGINSDLYLKNKRFEEGDKFLNTNQITLPF